MWISYNSSEVNEFHPICERCLNNALHIIGKQAEYQVLHHQYTGSLEMDYVVKNIATGKYLCVIEVKRTPSDVNSARYQYQAMSYVQMNAHMSEKPFYILTNLEYSYVFRYDSARSRVFQQMLSPGLIHTGDFHINNQADFENNLSQEYAQQLNNFINDTYSYLLTLQQFEEHMRNITTNNRNWKSSLAVLLYEYIRGSFTAVGRTDLPYDVSHYHNNVQRICTEAARINFKEIFDCPPAEYEPTTNIATDILSNLFDFGRQNISGDAIAGILHEIASTGMEHQGEVPTDLELARAMSIIAKSISGDIPINKHICDPAAGSGNLLSSAIEIYNLNPTQIKANDINLKLLELLSLRIGLTYPSVIRRNNTAQISANNITNIDCSYFESVSVVVMNPPFVAGINCVSRKTPFFNRIKEISGTNAITNVGQMNLEGAFIELVSTLISEDTVIACVLPKTHLTARGTEAVAIRQMLLQKFNLCAIFNYPEDGLFENVTKGTCVVFGKKGNTTSDVHILNCSLPVSDINLHQLSVTVANNVTSEAFTTVATGIDAISIPQGQLLADINNGWRKTSRELLDSINFIATNLTPSTKLRLLSNVPSDEVKRKRGTAGNNGGSDLIFLNRDGNLFAQYSNLATKIAMRNAKLNQLFVDDGDCAFLNISVIDDALLQTITENFATLPTRSGQQQRATKTAQQLEDILRRESQNEFPENSLLVPRAIRTTGKVYLSRQEIIVSTNFAVLSFNSYENAAISASWMSTIFYQLICEVNGKQQEGMRKMEVRDIETTLIPIFTELTNNEKSEILAQIADIEFLSLNTSVVRDVDLLWGRILFGNASEEKANEARRLLDFVANMRNPA